MPVFLFFVFDIYRMPVFVSGEQSTLVRGVSTSTPLKKEKHVPYFANTSNVFFVSFVDHSFVPHGLNWAEAQLHRRDGSMNPATKPSP
jgi:hypothetical protein